MNYIAPPDDNIDRNRSYGKRIGDIVACNGFGHVPPREAEVIARHSDNNRLTLLDSEGHEFEWTAEHCAIITKVEDRNNNI